MKHVKIDHEGVVYYCRYDAPEDDTIEAPDHVTVKWCRNDQGEWIAPENHNAGGDDDADSLDTQKDNAIAAVNLDAAITLGSSDRARQAEKRTQALAVIAAEDDGDDPNNMLAAAQIILAPLVHASIGIEAATLVECAELILERYNAAAIRENSIEVVRLAGKSSIRAATSSAEIEAASVIAFNAFEAIRQNDQAGS